MEAMKHRYLYQESQGMEGMEERKQCKLSKEFKESTASLKMLVTEKAKMLGVVDGLGRATTQCLTSSGCIVSPMSLEQEINLEFVSQFDVDFVLNIFEDFREEEIAEKEKQETRMEEDGESVLDVIGYDDLISCMTEQQKVCTLSEDYEHMPVTVMF